MQFLDDHRTKKSKVKLTPGKLLSQSDYSAKHPDREGKKHCLIFRHLEPEKHHPQEQPEEASLSTLPCVQP